MEQIKLVGKKVTTLGEQGIRLYVLVTGIGRAYIPKELGLKDGDTLNGTVTVEEKTYTDNADGSKRATPLVRWELTDYTSFKDQRSCALAELEINSIPNLQLDANYFAKIDLSAVAAG
jgi:hypothetical protein